MNLQKNCCTIESSPEVIQKFMCYWVAFNNICPASTRGRVVESVRTGGCAVVARTWYRLIVRSTPASLPGHFMIQRIGPTSVLCKSVLLGQ